MLSWLVLNDIYVSNKMMNLEHENEKATINAVSELPAVEKWDTKYARIKKKENTSGAVLDQQFFWQQKDEIQERTAKYGHTERSKYRTTNSGRGRGLGLDDRSRTYLKRLKLLPNHGDSRSKTILDTFLPQSRAKGWITYNRFHYAKVSKKKGSRLFQIEKSGSAFICFVMEK